MITPSPASSLFAEALNLPKSAVERLEERNIIRRAIIKHPFFSDIVEAYRLDKKFGEYEEGTVILRTINGITVVRGFPKIRRMLTIRPAILKHFNGKRVVAEEKMNGYNVRIVKAGKNLYAITRRGIVCPYTTEKVRECFDTDFFDAYPGYMLCCEAVGKSSPFVSSDVYGIDDLKFYVFDVRDGKTNRPMSVERKIEIAEKYGLDLVPVLGEILVTPSTIDDCVREIHEIVEELNRRGREGIVLKDVDMSVQLKYTTSAANCNDLRYAFRFFNEYGRDFMLSRIVREAFQSFEFDDEGAMKERCRRLGEAILKPMVESIKTVSSGKVVCETVKLKFSSFETLELFKEHLRLMGVNFRIEVVGEKGGKIEVELERVMRGTTDKISGILKGALWR